MSSTFKYILIINLMIHNVISYQISYFHKFVFLWSKKNFLNVDLIVHYYSVVIYTYFVKWWTLVINRRVSEEIIFIKKFEIWSICLIIIIFCFLYQILSKIFFKTKNILKFILIHLRGFPSLKSLIFQ